MTFLWPGLLTLLALLPFFGLLYWLIQQERHLGPRHRRLGLVAAARSPGLRRHVPPALFLAALALLLVALARPQIVTAQPQQHGTIILVFDVSASMAATDNAPTRLGAALAEAKTFIGERPEAIEIGLVAFSNDTVAQVAPTSDTKALFAALEALTPARSTSVGQGILAGLSLLALEPSSPTAAPGSAPAALVLFSDGENKLDPEPLDAARLAVPLGVRIYPVAFGSLKGTLLSVEGFLVHTQLEDEVLRDIADLTGGAYYDGGVQPDLQAVYRNLTLATVSEAAQLEVTNWVVAGALGVLLLGAACSLLWFGRLP
ncbi:MAG: VWA domain-containing protein [Anaerolineales bacterium]|nr:VWA domain-containing protein [Anaerolineales bacterium]